VILRNGKRSIRFYKGLPFRDAAAVFASGLPSLELLRELIPQAGYNRRTFETQPVRMPTYSGLQQ
jgi:hypothetical protein